MFINNSNLTTLATEHAHYGMLRKQKGGTDHFRILSQFSRITGNSDFIHKFFLEKGRE